MRRRLKRDREDWLRRVASATVLESCVSQAAADLGISFQVSSMRAGRTLVPHWQFRWQGGQLDYWPSKGNWWAKASGERGEVAHPREIVAVAGRLMGRPFVCQLCGGRLDAETYRLRGLIVCCECDHEAFFDAGGIS